MAFTIQKFVEDLAAVGIKAVPTVTRCCSAWGSSAPMMVYQLSNGDELYCSGSAHALLLGPDGNTLIEHQMVSHQIGFDKIVAAIKARSGA